MDVTSAAATPAATTGNSGSKPAVSADFETFLKMLTAQLENQDPLNPVDSNDFAVQLATFSGVEQQVLTNDLLTGISSQLGAGGLAQYAGWVGMEARVAAPAQFSGAPITVLPKVEPGADKAQLVVRNAQGVEVQRTDTALDGAPLAWSGTTSAGTTMPAGAYRFEVESFADGQVIGRTTAEVYTTVAEARVVDGAPVLLLDSGAEVAADQVTALRQPGG